jgi:hypothetical protein
MTKTPLTVMDAQGSARLKQITPACQVGPTERGQASARSLASKDGTIMSLIQHSKLTKSAMMAISSKMMAVLPNVQ